MKKWILSLATLPLITAASAQEKTTGPGLHYPTDKGSLLIGSDVLLGGAGFSNAGTYYNIGLTPRAGYFVRNNLAAGVELTGTFSGASGHYRSQSYGTGLFARYYFGKAAHKDGSIVKTRVFVEGGATYFASRARFLDPTDEIMRTKAFEFRGTVGLNYFIANNIALEGGIFYHRQTKNYVHNEYMVTPTQLGFKVGVQIFLRGKK